MRFGSWTIAKRVPLVTTKIMQVYRVIEFIGLFFDSFSFIFSGFHIVFCFTDLTTSKVQFFCLLFNIHTFSLFLRNYAILASPYSRLKSHPKSMFLNSFKYLAKNSRFHFLQFHSLKISVGKTTFTFFPINIQIKWELKPKISLKLTFHWNTARFSSIWWFRHLIENHT